MSVQTSSLSKAQANNKHAEVYQLLSSDEITDHTQIFRYTEIALTEQ